MIYKRGKVYWFRFEFLGRRYERSTRLRNERDARNAEAAFRTQLARGEFGLAVTRRAPTFKAYAPTFTAYVATNSAAHPATVQFYACSLRRLLEFKPLADARLDAIDAELIETYKQHRRKTVLPATVNHELATLSKALHLAMDVHKWLARVPKIRRLDGERERDFVLSADQEKAYLAVCPDELRDFAILALDTGVRVSEGLQLEWTDVTPTAIRIRQGKTKSAKRHLVLSERCRAMLAFRREMLDGPWVFPGLNGKHRSISSIEGLHKTARENARLEDGSGLPDDFVLHSLRHTFATRLGTSGADAFTLMRVLGHANVRISAKYVHPTPESLERAFERLDAMNRIMRGETEVHDDASVKSKTP